MTTLHGIKIIVYTFNSQELQKFLEELHVFFDAILYAGGMSIRAYLYKNCFIMYLWYDTCQSGQSGKKEAIEGYNALLQEKILPTYSSFFIEFYMHHWHLRDFQKEGHHIGSRFVGDHSLMDLCKDLDTCVDISSYYMSLNEDEKVPLQETDWRPGMPIGKYLSQYGKKESAWNPTKQINWGVCQIEDD